MFDAVCCNGCLIPAELRSIPYEYVRGNLGEHGFGLADCLDRFDRFAPTPLLDF